MPKGPVTARWPGPSCMRYGSSQPRSRVERVCVVAAGRGATPIPSAVLLDHPPQGRDGVGKDERDAHGDHNEGQQSHVGFPLSVVVLPVMAVILPRLTSCHEWQGCHLPSIYCQLCATMGG